MGSKLIVAIIQARMGSTRLPGKSLLPFGDTSVLGYLIKRISLSKFIDKIVVATTDADLDNKIVLESNRIGVNVFRGSEQDVLERFYKAAKEYKANFIVRLTADDPFKTASIIDDAIRKLLDENLDYCSNTISPSFPEGLDVEVFSYAALAEAYHNEPCEFEREHVTPYIWKNKNEKFKIGQIVDENNLSNWRMTIDYKSDYDDLCRLADLVPINSTYKELTEQIKKSKVIGILSPKTKRNEAYYERPY